MRTSKEILIEGSSELGFNLSENQLEKLFHYLELIMKWNKIQY